MFVGIHSKQQVGLLVIPLDSDVARAKHLAQLVPGQIDDRLEIHLGCQALLDAVDELQLGRPLLGLLEQPLGLVEQAGVLEGRSQGGCHGGQHA